QVLEIGGKLTTTVSYSPQVLWKRLCVDRAQIRERPPLCDSMSPANFISTLAGKLAGASRRAGVRAFALAVLALAAVAPAYADGIDVRKAAIQPADDGFQLEASFDIQFSPRLEEAVNRGVPLYFVVEFELARPRWYWFDEKPVQVSQTYKISYTP